MDTKYRVPALDKANAVLEAVSASPGKLRLIELSRELSIHKSSMFSLLHTMEALGWLRRAPGDTYELGDAFARFGSLYARQNGIVDRFRRLADSVMREIGETIQLARLDGRETFYLAKAEAPTPVRLASEPGMRFPAHQTALGKAMLATLPVDEVKALYGDGSEPLPAATPYSITSFDGLLAELGRIRAEGGIAYDLQEAVTGFCCAAAPVRDGNGRAAAAVSLSMPLHEWEPKRDKAAALIRKLADELAAGLF